MDVSGAPDLFVNRIAREISPIRLTGNYGGEILRHIVAFKPMPLRAGAFDAGVRDRMGEARATYARQLDPDRLAFVAFKQVPWHHHSRFALERSQLTLRSPYLDNELVALAFRAPQGAALETPLALRLIADGDCAARHARHRPRPAQPRRAAADADQTRLPGVHVPRRIRLRLRHARLAGAARRRVRRAAPRAAVPRASQVLPLPLLVPQRARAVPARGVAG
jgi:hypothetical protein